MARHPNDPRDYFGEVQKRNELRREARLPSLMWRLRQLDYGDLTLVRLTQTSSPI
jgi:hypothetical protein